MKNALKPLAKTFLIPSGLTAVATDARIHKKILELRMTTLIISNEKMQDIIKIAKSLEELRMLIKIVSEQS